MSNMHRRVYRKQIKSNKSPAGYHHMDNADYSREYEWYSAGDDWFYPYQLKVAPHGWRDYYNLTEHIVFSSCPRVRVPERLPPALYTLEVVHPWD